MEHVRYLKAASAICGALVLFAIGIMLTGYQAWDAKHIGTTVVVAIALVVCGYFAYKKTRASRTK